MIAIDASSRSETLLTALMIDLIKGKAQQFMEHTPQFTRQRTLAKAVSCKGVGVHSGITVDLSIKPAPANHGIKFIRKDLPDSPAISAIFNNVVDTSLATVIGNEGAIVSTIEHLMASFFGLSIDNAVVELSGYEMPIMDGSAAQFTRMILEAGIQELSNPRTFIVITEDLAIEEFGKIVRATPHPYFKLTCNIEFDHPLIKKQTYVFDMCERTFAEEISMARTFGFYKDVEQLRLYGLAKGATLDTGIAIDKENILNEGGLRFSNEFVRHKLLDCLGDFSLLGMPILGHIETFKSGHAFNHAFLKELFNRKDSWETQTFDDHPLQNPHKSKSLAI
ncbi:MAG: UDP-3-O-acyl-N-acetylglucosamine deacetylase [Desulfobacteraceae bacterium]|jgi:UDP-3-O-[3-hydroxymyristoyl] N-acetylglucosamine deacetylase